MEQNKDQGGAAVRGEAVAEFNINDMMIVTLTPEGAAVWNQRYANLPLPADLVPEKVDAGYVLKDQLWDLMGVFGPHTGLCRPAMFVDMRMAHAKPVTCKLSSRAADAPSEPSGLTFDQWLDRKDENGWTEREAPCGEFRDMLRGWNAAMKFGKSRAADALDSQPTEPTGYVRISELKKLESNRVAGVGMMVQKEGGDGWTPIYASSQPTDGGVRNGCDLEAVHAFLMGESPLEGVQFGDKHPTKAGAQWWRLNLRAALAKG